MLNTSLNKLLYFWKWAGLWNKQHDKFLSSVLLQNPADFCQCFLHNNLLITPLKNNWDDKKKLSKKLCAFSNIWNSLYRDSTSWIKESCLQNETPWMLEKWSFSPQAMKSSANQEEPLLTSLACQTSPLLSPLTCIAGSPSTVAIGHNCYGSTEKPHCSSSIEWSVEV